MATKRKTIVGGMIDDLVSPPKRVRKPAAKKVAKSSITPSRLAQELIDNDPEVRKRRWTERVAEMKIEVRRRAGASLDGWVELTLEPEDDHPEQEVVTCKVARIPFERWQRRARNHRQDEWPNNVCPSGMKMQMDDRDHSDWWLSNSLDIPIEFAYDSGRLGNWEDRYHAELDPSDEEYKPWPVERVKMVSLSKRLDHAAWMYRLEGDQDRKKNSIFLVSNKKKKIEGYVMHVRTQEDVFKFVEEAVRWKNTSYPQHIVAVIPNCSFEYDLVIRHAGAIITEVGSAAAHVVKIAREDKVPVIMCPTAFKEYWDGERIAIEDKSIRVKY